jgi:hypothetical protein
MVKKCSKRCSDRTALAQFLVTALIERHIDGPDGSTERTGPTLPGVSLLPARPCLPSPACGDRGRRRWSMALAEMVA